MEGGKLLGLSLWWLRGETSIDDVLVVVCMVRASVVLIYCFP